MLKPDARSLLIVFLVIAVALRQGLAVLLIGLLLLALAVAALWSRWALRQLTYERTLNVAHAFVGDDIVLTQRVENAKLLSLPSLQIDETVPAALSFSNARLMPHPRSDLQIMRRRAVFRPYEAITWTTALRCTKRGLYTFGPTHLEASDAFGLHLRELDLPAQTKLVVYPEVVAIPDLRLAARRPIGDSRAARQLITDPSRTVGVRDYQRDDPFKAIHWGATARRGELQTRVYEPTTDLSVAIMLDLDTFEHYWEGIRYDLIEYMISAAAAVATQATDTGLSVGLYCNGSPTDSGQIIRIPPSRSPTQLATMLDALGRLSPYSVVPFAGLITRLGPTLDWGTTIVLISAVPSEMNQIALLRLGRGRRIVWLYAGEGATPTVPGVEVYTLAGVAGQWAERRRQSMTASPS